MSDTFWGAMWAAVGGLVVAIGAAIRNLYRDRHDLGRADLDGANLAWKELFEKAQVRSDATSLRIDALADTVCRLTNSVAECDERHKDCERQYAMLKQDFDRLKQTVGQVQAQVNGS